MSHDLYELLAAYIDGIATDDERARVEADPELVAEAARLRLLGTALRDQSPPRAAARESAIIAALAVFDAEFVTPWPELADAGADAPTLAMSAAPRPNLDPNSELPSTAQDVPLPPPQPPAPVAQFEPRRRRISWNAGLGIAAATLAVVGIGVVIAQRPNDDSVARSTAPAVYDDLTAPAPGGAAYDTTAERAVDPDDRAGAGADSAAVATDHTAGTESATRRSDGVLAEAAPAAPAPVPESADAAMTELTPPAAPPLAAAPPREAAKDGDAQSSPPADAASSAEAPSAAAAYDAATSAAAASPVDIAGGVTAAALAWMLAQLSAR